MVDLNDLVTRDELEFLQEEIFKIKARQREYKMHDDWCQKRGDEIYQTGAPTRDCNCWLVKEN